MLLTAALVYLLVVLPLQKSLARTEANLSALTKAVDKRIADLTETVNHNAKAANRTSDHLSDLARTLVDVSSIAENANRHAHSHTRW